MTTAKIVRALKKAACTAPHDAEKATFAFMEAIGTNKAEEGTAFEADFYASSTGDDAAYQLVRGWLQDARTLKRQSVALLKDAADRWPMGLGNLDAYGAKLNRQYRAELRKLAERINVAMEAHEP